MPRIPQLESTVRPIAGNQGQFNLSMPDQSFAGLNALTKTLDAAADGLLKQGRYDAEQAEKLEREKALVNAQTAWNLYEQDSILAIENTNGEKAYKPGALNEGEMGPPITASQKLNVDSIQQLEKIKNSIQDEKSRVAFEGWAQPQRIKLIGKSITKANQEQRKDDEASYKQSIKTISDRIAIDNSFLNDGINQMKDTVRNYGETIGKSKDERDREIADYSNHFRGTVLNNMMRTDPASARSLLDIWKEDGVADEKLIAQYDRAIDIRYQTDQVLALPKSERKAALDNIKDNDVRDKVKDEIKSFDANRRMELNDQAKPVVDRYDKLFHDPKKPLPSRQNLIDQVYAELPDEEHVNERHGILAMYDAEVHRRNPPKEKVPEGMKELMRQIRLARYEAKVTREGIIDPNSAFMDIRSKQNPDGILEPGDITEARSIVKNNATDPRVGKFVTDFAEEKKTNFKNKEDRQLFERDLSEQVRDARKTNPNLDDKTIRAIGERRLKSYVDDRWFGNTGIPLLDRQTQYESDFYKSSSLSGPGYKTRKDATPLLELVNEVRDPKGNAFKTFGTAVKGAYADTQLGVVRFKAKGREYAVRMDGTIGEIVNNK